MNTIGILAFNIGSQFYGSGGFRNITDVSRLATAGFGDALIIAGVVLVFMIIISGYQMISGSGNPQQMAQAQKILTYAIIGFILVVAAYFILYILQTSTGTLII